MTNEELWEHMLSDHPYLLELLELEKIAGMHEGYHATDAPTLETEEERAYREEQERGEWEDRF